MYSEKQYKSLSVQRKANVILHELQSVQCNWQNKNIHNLVNYFAWSKDVEELRYVVKHRNLLDSENIREFLNLMVPLERLLGQSVSDFDILINSQDKLKQRKTLPVYLILDHLRSAFNVGSIFRTSECLGIKHIYCVGYTPTPRDKHVQKTAMGTTEQVEWSQHDRLPDVIDSFKKQKIPIIALETTKQSKNLNTFSAPKECALLLGNERFGIEASHLKHCEHVVEIPMLGSKNSLNVANAFSIIAYELQRQWA